MMIRYFAPTDNSEVGRVALGYLTSLMRMAPVRVGSLSGFFSGAWEAASRLMVTPLHDHFINVVCAPPERWVWAMRIPMRTSDGKRVADVAKGTAELYTHGRRNVLLSPIVPTSDSLRCTIETAQKYESVVAPTEALVQDWARHGVCASLIRIPVTDHEAFRHLVMSDS